MSKMLQDFIAAAYGMKEGRVCRGVVSTMAVQIGTMPEVRRMVCEFSDRTKFPERPMITLLEGSPSVYLLGWREGDFTEVHDHGPCEVGVFVIQGNVVEDLYACQPIEGSKDLNVLLQISRFLGAGQLVSCPENYLHRVGNVFPETAATLHVYGPVLDDMRLYKAQGNKLIYSGCWGCDENPQH